jgi:hypothetical protein
MSLNLRHRRHGRSRTRAVGFPARAIVVFLVIIAGAGPADAVTQTVAGGSGPRNVAGLAIDTGQQGYLGDTRGYRYVILQEYMYSHVAAIKAANPKTKVLAYMEAPVTKAQSCGSSPSAYLSHDSFGVYYCYASAYHPEWFLHNGSGQRLTYTDYPAYSAMDVANPAYQSTWAKNVIAAVKADGFDGVYMDDVNTYPGHGINGKIAEYTDQGYGQAMVDFVRAVAPQIRSSGLAVAANVAANPWTSWQRTYGLAIAGQLDVYNREHYSRYGDICGPFSVRFNTTANNGTPPLATVLNYDQAVQAAGARLSGIDYGYTPATSDDLATMSYGRAAFLLAWDGKDGGAYIFRPCGKVDPANPRWMIDVGTPTTPAVLSGPVFTRTFTTGLVYLNPSPDTSVSVSIPAGYVDANGTPTTGTKTLPPQTAIILRTTSSR